MGFLSNLFYKQRPVQAPQFPNRRRIYLYETMLSWDEDYIKSNSFTNLFIDKGVKLSLVNRQIDFQNVILDGARLPHGKRQDEKALKLRVELSKWDLLNAVFEDIPGGNYVVGVSTTYQKCCFKEIGEDAISTPRSTGQANHYCGLKLLQCNFYNRSEKDGGDKSIQLNNAHGCILRQCFVTGGITGARLGESRDQQKSGCIVEGVTFDNVPTAINASGVLALTIKDAVYRNVKKELQKGSEVKITQ